MWLLANTFPNRMYLMAGTSFGHQYPDGGNPCDPDQALPQVIFIDSPSGGSGLDQRCKLRWSI